MKFYQRFLAASLALVLVAEFIPKTHGCGPEILMPIFVFKESPDVPFAAFAGGKIGIVQPTFGRKTLVISYRYLNGGSFTPDEQHELVDALKGKGPEDDEIPIKPWTEMRTIVLPNEEKAPAIYEERSNGGYDFFPNCTKNAFEVAIETLKDRVNSYGSDDPGVREWLRGQDLVFQNCSGGSTIPATLDPASPPWLRKDRDYQIAAANFYSLNFEEARTRFAKIAADVESPWQQTAEYLVARTLVREASLVDDEEKKDAQYGQAESYLTNLLGHTGKFQNASKRLLGLVKYRIHPEERLGELARALEHQTGNENLRQDLIDYTWLLDNFIEHARKEEEERQKRLNPPEQTTPSQYVPDEKYLATQRGELIQIWFTPLRDNGEPDYEKARNWFFKHDASENEVLQYAEADLARKLSPAETKQLQERYKSAMELQHWYVSPNRKFDPGDYEGCYAECRQVPLELLPTFMRIDSLNDWILSFQSSDPRTYVHALRQWKETHSVAWLVAALIKADQTSRGVLTLIADAEKIPKDAPAYPTVAYQLVRLRIAAGKRSEAKKLADEVLANTDALTVSAQNLFREQRMSLADSISEFLKFAGRKPIAFSKYGKLGTIREMMELEKSFWAEQYYQESKEEYEQKVEEQFRELLKWDDQMEIDDDTAEILDWHLPLSMLVTASRDPALPSHLQREFTLTAWTRAVVLENDEIARKTALEVIKVAPEMAPLMNDYLAAKTKETRDDAALYVLLKFPTLTPLVFSGVPLFSTAENNDYYFETSWWCAPDDTGYDEQGSEVPKKVPAPAFLNSEVLTTASKERGALKALGNAKSFLGQKVVKWANRSPDDPRIPEALFIAAMANEGYKYGCGMWEHDDETKEKLVTLLQEKYPNSEWTVKWNENSQ